MKWEKHEKSTKNLKYYIKPKKNKMNYYGEPNKLYGQISSWISTYL